MRWFSALRKQPITPATVATPGAKLPPKSASPVAVSTHTPAAPAASASGSGVDIQYVDMAIEGGAVFAAPVGALLERVEPLIQRLYHEIGWGRDDFETLIRPMVVRYAEYVHLLPASESHHHARLGGLLVHGLEVAIEAARSSREAVVDLDRVFLRDIELRASRNRLWPVAAACAGFLHDLGKALVDLMVARTDNDEVWNPYESSLSDWITANSVQGYTVSWRAGQRLRRHEPFGLVIAWPVIGKELITLLNAFGRDMFEEMLLGALEDTQTSNGLGRIVNEADTASVRRDREAQRKRWREGIVGGHPVVNRILEAFQGLMAEGAWQPNTVGGCIWVTPQGVFLSWATAVSQARGWLRENAANGTIPNDPQAIADLLIDAKIARPRMMADGSHSRVWMVKPLTPSGITGLGQGLGIVQMVLIPDVNLLFKGRAMPDPIELEIAADTTWAEVVVAVEEESEDEEDVQSVAPAVATTASSPAAPPVQPAPVPSPAPVPPPPTPEIPAVVNQEPVLAPAPIAVATPPRRAAELVASEQPNVAEAIEFFKSCGIFGDWIIRLMADCAKDPDPFDNLICYREKKLLLRWPDTASGYLESPTDIVKFLNERPDLLATSYKGAVIDPTRGSLVIKALVDTGAPLWPAMAFSEKVSRYAFLIGDHGAAIDRKIRSSFAEWVSAQALRKDVSVIPAGQLIVAYARGGKLKPTTILSALEYEPSLILGVGGHEADQRVDMAVASELSSAARKAS